MDNAPNWTHEQRKLIFNQYMTFHINNYHNGEEQIGWEAYSQKRWDQYTKDDNIINYQNTPGILL